MPGELELDQMIGDAWDAMKAHRRARGDDVVCEQDGCGAEAVPGGVRCRNHGGMLPVAQAAAEVRLAAARLKIGSMLEDAVTDAVQFYIDVMRGNVPGSKTSERIQAADRIVALCGGQIALQPEEAEEGSGPVLILRQMLQAAPDDRLERLALRIGAIPAQSREDS